MSILDDWLKDWKFWVALISGSVALVSGIWLGTQGTVRYGTIGPYPLRMHTMCGDDLGSTDHIPPAGNGVLSDNEATNLRDSISALLDACAYDEVSLGAWYVCPDSSCVLDSLWVKIRSPNGHILNTFVINATVDSIPVKIGIDSNTVLFKVPALVSGEQMALLIVSQGTSDAPYVVDFTKGDCGHHLLDTAEDYPNAYRLKRYSLFAVAGVLFSWFFGIVRIKIKRQDLIPSSLPILESEEDTRRLYAEFGSTKEGRDDTDEQR